MKKILTVALALAFVFVAINAYACGDKSNATKAKSGMTSNSASCSPDTKVMKADAGSCEPAARAMTAEAGKTEGASSCPSMKDADSKMEKIDGGCCAGKSTKTSTASQKAEVKQEDEKSGNPVLIMSAPTGSTMNQE